MALNPPLPPWNEWRIWIIGASTGIGAATAQASARRRRARRAVRAQGRRARGGRRRQRARADRAAGLHRQRAGRGSVGARAGGVGRCRPRAVVAGTHAEMRAWELTEERHGAAQDQSARRHRYRGHGPAGIARAGQGRARHRRVGRRLSRPAQSAGLRRVEGGADQFHRDALSRPASPGPRRLPDQPRLREDAADRPERIQDAAPDHRRRSSDCDHRRPARRRLRDRLSQGLHAPAQVPALVAVPLVFCVDPSGHRAVDVILPRCRRRLLVVK